MTKRWVVTVAIISVACFIAAMFSVGLVARHNHEVDKERYCAGMHAVYLRHTDVCVNVVGKP